MLSATEICRRLSLETSDDKRLAIAPMPNLQAVKDRGGTSVDLRLGRWFRTFRQNQASALSLAVRAEQDAALQLKTKQHFVSFGEPFVLHPGRFVLGVTLEWVRLPKDLSGYVTGKSTLGRHGLVIETAAGLHPGFSGCLTLELANVGEVPLELFPGMEVCQVFLHKTSKSEGAQNAGRLFGQRKPLIERPTMDPVFQRISDYKPPISGPVSRGRAGFRAPRSSPRRTGA